MTSAYSIAASLGYPYIRGDGMDMGGIWLSRFTRSENGSGPAIYVGFKGRRAVIRRETADGRLVAVTVTVSKKQRKQRHR